MTVRQRITSVATIGAVVATVGGFAAATPAMSRLGGNASDASAAAGGGFSCASQQVKKGRRCSPPLATTAAQL